MNSVIPIFYVVFEDIYKRLLFLFPYIISIKVNPFWLRLIKCFINKFLLSLNEFGHLKDRL